MNHFDENLETYQGMLTDQEKEQMESFLNFIESNSQRIPVKITIQFQHKRWNDNHGFASINVPISNGRVALGFLTRAMQNECEKLLTKNTQQ